MSHQRSEQPGAETFLLHRLMHRRLEQELRCADREEETIGRAQGAVLGFLYRRGEDPVYQRDVEAHFNVRRSTASGILGKMEDAGLIRREPVPADGRLKRLILTEAGRAAHERFLAAAAAVDETMCRGIDPERLRIFRQVTAEMCRNLEEEGS